MVFFLVGAAAFHKKLQRFSPLPAPQFIPLSMGAYRGGRRRPERPLATFILPLLILLGLVHGTTEAQSSRMATAREAEKGTHWWGSARASLRSRLRHSAPQHTADWQAGRPAGGRAGGCQREGLFFAASMAPGRRQQQRCCGPAADPLPPLKRFRPQDRSPQCPAPVLPLLRTC